MPKQARIDHLLRRTGFGITPQQRKNAFHMGYEKTVQELVHATLGYKLAKQPPATPFPAIVIPATFIAFGQGITWWLNTLATTTSPLNERLTMFWHRHFATNGGKVFQPGWMFDQNLTFREHGVGPFADLLAAMVRDPALLRWLDAEKNPAENPNENLARELLELFTLGRGAYTEKDVKELAKLTTGRRLTLGGRTPEKPKGVYEGPVALLGVKGQLRLQDMTERLAVHPATAKRMVKHLWDDFAACDLPAKEAERLEKLWRGTRGNVILVLREMFLSPHFYDAPRQRVTSPVEYWITCARLTGTKSFKMEDSGLLEKAGEQLFFPPSVKGWDLGQALIHPSALQTRLEIASQVVSRLKKHDPVLKGLATTPNRARYLHHWSGGHILPQTLPPDLADFKPKDALLLALASPDLWTS